MRNVFSSSEIERCWQECNAAANVFHIKQEQYTQLEADDWIEYDATYLHPPFDTFAITVDDPHWIPTIDNTAQLTQTHRIFIDTRQPNNWYIAEQSSIKQDELELGTLIFGVSFNAGSGEAYRLSDSSELPARELARIIRIVVGFILILQHKAVTTDSIIDPNRPISRQIRRAEGYMDSEHFSVILRPRSSIPKIIGQVNQSDGLKYMRPHGVRGHLRQLPSGRIIPVRAHKRGEREHAAVVKYDATRLGIGTPG